MEKTIGRLESGWNRRTVFIWREMICRVKKMSSKSVNAVVDAISCVSNTKKTLPEPINLDEVGLKILNHV